MRKLHTNDEIWRYREVESKVVLVVCSFVCSHTCLCYLMQVRLQDQWILLDGQATTALKGWDILVHLYAVSCLCDDAVPLRRPAPRICELSESQNPMRVTMRRW